MIVRILGEGQWRLADGKLDGLNELDDQVERAIEAGDEPMFRSALGALLLAVRQSGTEVPVEELVDSDLILPPADASLAEVQEMLSDDGLIPG
ncbi:MAG: PspA-associated protein PspAA [Nocardioidaceae bacterium]